MPWNEIINEIIVEGFGTLKQIALIIFPLMVVLEIGRDIGILDKVSQLFAPVLKIFKLPAKTALPLLVGQIFGLTYGAGVIIQISEEENISQNKLLVMAVFLAICHAVIEDTLLFVAVGGRGGVILATRLFLAVGITYIFSKFLIKGTEEIETSIES
ncbi:nucleoside recognition domain-containing protein [Acetohalobium arabaticum]|uniref:Nucleoside recognition domain protein n=1 Tax=Acetohalobium arabaticum (strain ATCC 49924 / DSM 5501 / Z-7288) TaxID=574087 RepID=D9QRZ1_ACEAZ|nr:nucleoside recognition domain-containing protein [Acetohalobium arabaticum]ADL13282.1 nucleoside recognition domain protein [Acetohalobium arabaticum DSM 5501]